MSIFELAGARFKFLESAGSGWSAFRSRQVEVGVASNDTESRRSWASDLSRVPSSRRPGLNVRAGDSFLRRGIENVAALGRSVSRSLFKRKILLVLTKFWLGWRCLVCYQGCLTKNCAVYFSSAPSISSRHSASRLPTAGLGCGSDILTVSSSAQKIGTIFAKETLSSIKETLGRF